MAHQFRPCKHCSGEAIYIHLPKMEDCPPEHQAICGKCGWKTEIHRYSFGVVREWNRKKGK
jgi:superfamily II helicase